MSVQPRDSQGRFLPRDAWVVRGRWIKHIDPGLSFDDDDRRPSRDGAFPDLREFLNAVVRLWHRYRNNP